MDLSRIARRSGSRGDIVKRFAVHGHRDGDVVAARGRRSGRAGAAAADRADGAARAAAEQRYQIGQMERVLEGAVEHGVAITRDRLQALAQMPADTAGQRQRPRARLPPRRLRRLLRRRVPSFETTLTWSLRTLDQNDLGLDSALRTLQTHVEDRRRSRTSSRR